MKSFKLIILLLCITLIAASVNANIPHSKRAIFNADLPVIITKAKIDKEDKLILFISGDGGWNSFSQKLVDCYAANGFNVVGFNSLKYFWKKKTPQETANDIAALLNKYSTEWHKKKIIICGFSFGADVAPFIYRRLPDDLKSRVSLVQLISPSSFTDFEIHVMDLLGSGNAVRSMNIAAEVKLMDVPVICYYGEQEKEKSLSEIKTTGFKIIILNGDHHYAKSYPEIAKINLLL
ncbi:AcvB/VirJ family lysyl-phosphatidylglycerol hydrolase [Mucilaginibacter sp.]|uniref:AcvB/VirJ family lysyl-phosphatidylglycerol hydrolase n=1 Tax=Mucilaginibacter sp. TaxID=1882438 RepID=UPI003D0E35B4